MSFITNITGVPVTGAFGPDGAPSGARNDNAVVGSSSSVISNSQTSGPIFSGDQASKSVSSKNFNVLGGGTVTEPNEAASDSTSTRRTLSQNVTTAMTNTAFRGGFNRFDATFAKDPAGGDAGIFAIQQRTEGGPNAGAKGIDKSITNRQEGGVDNNRFISYNIGAAIPQSPGAQASNIKKPRAADNPCGCFDKDLNPIDLDTTTTDFGCFSGAYPSGCDFDGFKVPVFTGTRWRSVGEAEGGGMTPETGYFMKSTQSPFGGAGNCSCWNAEDGAPNTLGNTRYVDNLKDELTGRVLACTRAAINGRSSAPVCQQYKDNDPSKPYVDNCSCTWAHKLAFIGSETGAGTGTPCVQGGDWWYEVRRCNALSTSVPANSGKLIRCYETAFGIETTELTKVAEWQSCSPSDPCFCSSNYSAGPKVGPTIGPIEASDECDTVYWTGCLSNSADGTLRWAPEDGNYYALATGTTPTWSNSECAWMTSVWKCDPIFTGLASHGDRSGEVLRCALADQECYADQAQIPGNANPSTYLPTFVCPNKDTTYTVPDTRIWEYGYTERDGFETSSYIGNPSVNYGACETAATTGGLCFDLYNSGTGMAYAVGDWVKYNVGSSHPLYKGDRGWEIVSAQFSGVRLNYGPQPTDVDCLPSGDPNCKWQYLLRYYECGPTGDAYSAGSWSLFGVASEEQISKDGQIGCTSYGAGYCSGVIETGNIWGVYQNPGSYVNYNDGAGHSGCQWIVGSDDKAPFFSGSPTGTGVDDCVWWYYLAWVSSGPYGGSDISGWVGPVRVNQINRNGC